MFSDRQDCTIAGWNCLFQFYEEQNEDRPDSNGDRKLYYGCLAHCAAPGQRIRKEHHRQSGEHAKNQFACPLHECLTSLFFCPDRSSRRRGVYASGGNGTSDLRRLRLSTLHRFSCEKSRVLAGYDSEWAINLNAVARRVSARYTATFVFSFFSADRSHDSKQSGAEEKPNGRLRNNSFANHLKSA
jgi:hypothetical protein